MSTYVESLTVYNLASVKSPETGHHGARNAARSAMYGVMMFTCPALSKETGRSIT